MTVTDERTQSLDPDHGPAGKTSRNSTEQYRRRIRPDRSTRLEGLQQTPCGDWRRARRSRRPYRSRCRIRHPPPPPAAPPGAAAPGAPPGSRFPCWRPRPRCVAALQLPPRVVLPIAAFTSPAEPSRSASARLQSWLPLSVRVVEERREDQKTIEERAQHLRRLSPPRLRPAGAGNRVDACARRRAFLARRGGNRAWRFAGATVSRAASARLDTRPRRRW